MSQHDFNIANQSFPATRVDLNNALQALATNSSGATAPATPYANQWWYDTDTSTLKLRDEADAGWLEFATIDQATGDWTLAHDVDVTGTLTADGLVGDVTGNVTGNVTGDLTGDVIASVVTISSTTSLKEIIEAVTIDTSTTGTITFDVLSGGVKYFNTAQTANRTINFTNANTTMAIGESMSFAVLMTQTGTAYYLNAYEVDSSSVTPLWQGATTPAAGNADSIDSYSFTIIKTADATFTALASQTQFA